MSDPRIVDLFQTQERFLRSVHLERDFADPKALDGYVVTPQTKKYLNSLTEGLSSSSGRRAWRITGNFGAGKSSFALFLAHLFGAKRNKLPARLRQFFDDGQSLPKKNFLPILVTGAREPLAAALLRALHREVGNLYGGDESVEIVAEIKQAFKSESFSDEDVAALITRTARFITKSKKAGGLFIVLDELGKFLEFAALNPEKQDVFLLQRLGEEAARSGDSPIFVVGLLHEGFNAYADKLSIVAQREWEKVAERFEEIFFDQPLEQIAGLVTEALNLRSQSIPSVTTEAAREAMKSALDLRWYGASAADSNLIESAAGIYPLHPTTLPILVQLFRRFGQNQRSLFSFLMTNEPGGLRDFAQNSVKSAKFYRLADLYDYTRVTFGHRLGLQSYRSHWNLIESIIESFPAEEKIELQILKTVGLLNLIDNHGLPTTEEAIVAALVNSAEEIKPANVCRAIKKLKEKGALYFRGKSSGYCLWSHTSVNLDFAYEESVRTLGKELPARVSSLIQPYLETRPLVARRHYIETGNLRHFDVRFVPVNKLGENIDFDYAETDGLIVVALCENRAEYRAALDFAHQMHLSEKPDVIIAVPKPLEVLAGLYQEVQRWEWIETNTPELNNDSYARREVTRRLTNVRQSLDKRVQSLIGIQSFTGDTELKWFSRGEKLPLKSNRQLLEILSRICDEVYYSAPVVYNELINRRQPSSAANGARTRLLERIFGSSEKDYLGLNPDKKPPEMAIYLSLLKDSNIHHRNQNGFALQIPEAADDKYNFRPTFERIEKILLENAEGRVKVSDLMERLRRPPFGVRDGLSPILVAIFAVVFEQNIAFYDKGAFMREMYGLDIKRLTKNPENFEIQYCKIAGVRSELFKLLLNVLEQQLPNSRKSSANENSENDVLDIVRPLCVFAAELPAYTLKTNRLSTTAVAVRKALLSATEPAMLLFRDLPIACGFEPIKAETDQHKSEPDGMTEAFVETLGLAIEELRLSFIKLQDRIKLSLIDFFDLPETVRNVREILSQRADSMVVEITESRLKGFCLQLADSVLAEAGWLESLGSFVCAVPPNKWQDLDEERFLQEMAVLVGRFKRVESMYFQRENLSKNMTAVRVSVTNLDGTERDDVIYIAEDEESKIAKIEAQMFALLKDSKRLGLAAGARAFYKIMVRDED